MLIPQPDVLVRSVYIERDTGANERLEQPIAIIKKSVVILPLTPRCSDFDRPADALAKQIMFCFFVVHVQAPLARWGELVSLTLE